MSSVSSDTALRSRSFSFLSRLSSFSRSVPKVLGISQSSVYYKPRPVSDADLKLMHRNDKLHMEFPFAGSRMLLGLLVQEGFKVGRLHVATVEKRMGIEALDSPGGKPLRRRPEPVQTNRANSMAHRTFGSYPSSVRVIRSPANHVRPYSIGVPASSTFTPDDRSSGSPSVTFKCSAWVAVARTAVRRVDARV